ncbi:Smr/MutS family protein [Lysobacter sp. SG-8]|uniref:Smr/MutS family protein n=1 Tax=Marilutibacter penaei TaxID=2759900 RepID=A0A7W3U5Z9_9GAMM|nr:Smr/MutS family protein [Lysobacter penaei]MBB1089559.1 Smr/MutS family protein [Lysobacter penaei]
MKRSRPPEPKPPVDGDDLALFRDAVGPVRDLKPRSEPPGRPRPKPRARMAELDELDAAEAFKRGGDLPVLDAAATLAYRRDLLPRAVYQRLKRGELAPQDELDLHGLDARTAERQLRAFMADAHRDGLGCVRLIHGKGRQSEGAPVLKNMVDRLLRHRSDVLGFHSAPAAQGGTGAVLVLLAPRAPR